jgi:hypothetical protein
MQRLSLRGNPPHDFHGHLPLVHFRGVFLVFAVVFPGGFSRRSGEHARMAIDTYAPCPGGTGKKIKFCCADLMGDLEQLDTLIEGDQISAALDQVKRLEERTPGRACLMATRTKLELASKRYAEAVTSSQAFLDAFPQNPLALGQAAVTDAISGRMQEAAAGFDKARDRARDASEGEARQISEELVRIAATLVQAAAQTGHTGFAQGIVDWLVDAALGTEDERRMLAAFVGSSGVPPALRTRVRLEDLPGESPWRAEFDTAIKQARDWRLSKAQPQGRRRRLAAAVHQHRDRLRNARPAVRGVGGLGHSGADGRRDRRRRGRGHGPHHRTRKRGRP